MTLTELLPGIRSLPRSDKLHLIQLLAADVAKEEQLTADWKNATIDIWSPLDSEDAAKTLLQVLAADKASTR